jgi:hypothetical protein
MEVADSKIGRLQNCKIHYQPNEKVTIAGTEMVFCHWITTPEGQRPFFHYYVNGEQFGYIKNDSTRTI